MVYLPWGLGQLWGPHWFSGTSPRMSTNNVAVPLLKGDVSGNQTNPSFSPSFQRGVRSGGYIAPFATSIGSHIFAYFTSRPVHVRLVPRCWIQS